jgi:hypothetical protein
MPVKNPSTLLRTGIIPGQKVTKEKQERARELRRDMTPAEKILWEELPPSGTFGGRISWECNATSPPSPLQMERGVCWRELRVNELGMQRDKDVFIDMFL